VSSELPPLALRTCVTCRHLLSLGQSQAVPGLVESTSERWRCLLFGDEAEEFPYFPADRCVEIEVPSGQPTVCPGWTWWQMDETAKEGAAGEAHGDPTAV